MINFLKKYCEVFGRNYEMRVKNNTVDFLQGLSKLQFNFSTLNKDDPDDFKKSCD